MQIRCPVPGWDSFNAFGAETAAAAHGAAERRGSVARGAPRSYWAAAQSLASGGQPKIREAKDQLGLEFVDGSPMKVKVQQVCADLVIETGWEAQAAAPEPECDGTQWEELTLGRGRRRWYT